jgi:NADPH:quinone reductase-like Zn-dependent oxidoreductase
VRELAPGGVGAEASWRMLARLTAWNLLPNGRHAHFFNLRAGKRLRPARYRAQVREDLAGLFGLLREGRISAAVAARFPLTDAAAALRFAEQRGKTGKVALIA